MTERLKALLHEEADTLTIPTPPTDSALAAGQRLRRRRHLGRSAAALALVCVVGGGVAMGQTLGEDAGTQNDPAGTTPAAPAPAVFAVGSTVYVGSQAADVPHTVHSLHYTSAGILVRSNPNDGASDGSGPENLTLARTDGTTVDLGVVPEGAGPATDADQPYFVLAEADGPAFKAVVRDAVTGDVVREVALPEGKPSYWPVPPLSLDGDTLYVGFKSSTSAVDWQSGEHRAVDGMAGGLPVVEGGRTVVGNRQSGSVLDAATGEVLLEVPFDDYGSMDLSPDGRFARVSVEGTQELSTSIEVYDVDSGDHQMIEGDSHGWGWTADGALFRVTGDTVTICHGSTGACRDSPAPVQLADDAFPRLGGQLYES